MMMTTRRRYTPTIESCEPRLALDGEAAQAMGSSTPQYAIPPLPDDVITVEGMMTDAHDADAAGQGFPNDSGAFTAYDVPPSIFATTDDAGYAAGTLGSSWTGDVDPLPPYAPPTAIPPYDAYD